MTGNGDSARSNYRRDRDSIVHPHPCRTLAMPA